MCFHFSERVGTVTAWTQQTKRYQHTSLQNNIHVSKVYCWSAYSPGACGPPYYCTLLVYVVNGLGGLNGCGSFTNRKANGLIFVCKQKDFLRAIRPQTLCLSLSCHGINEPCPFLPARIWFFLALTHWGACTNTHIHPYPHTHTHTYTQTHTQRTTSHAHKLTHPHETVSYIQIHTFTHLHNLSLTHTQTHRYTHMHTHTHTHNHKMSDCLWL